MASVDFMKLKTIYDVRAIVKHCDKEERLKSEHANKHIDKSVTSRNGQITGRGYKETMSLYSKRIKELDNTTNTNKRKDRVTAFALEVPIPEDVITKDVHEFVKNVQMLVCHQYGRDNVLNLYVHNDEVHDYKDAKTGENRTSLRHVHFIVVSEVNGQLNGKKFSSKANMQKLNRAIDNMSRKQFGVSFLTGKGTKSREEVEELKLQSERKELEEDKEEFMRYKASEQSKMNEEKEQYRKEAEEQRRETEALQKKLRDMLTLWEQTYLPYLMKLQDKLTEKQKKNIDVIQKKVDRTRDLIPEPFPELEEPNHDTGWQYQ